MSDFSNNKTDLQTLMNLFATIKKLCKYYSVDQAIDVMDAYLKTDNAMYLTPADNIRNDVVECKMREKVYPLIEGKYKHLADYIDEIIENINAKESHK